MIRFHFPVVIIDEDYRSENTSGLGIRALAEAIQKEGMEVLGVTSYGDLSQFAQQQSRASAFILSIDDEEFTPGPELDPAVLNLRKFIEEIRNRNPDIPIYVYGETRTSQHLPNDVLRELHGFIHMFEDTPEFVARHIIREARSYLDGLAPPFFKALMDYAQDGSYSWHCPGHSGGVAFLKSPVGQMFHQFFGENMLRADVCNAVEELGQLLDHTGPVAASEKNAARIFNADHCFFVTNGTSTSNKMVWHHTVAPGDVVVIDRNCHKSNLHAIIMCGAIPVFMTPTRNHYGIIGPIPESEFSPEAIRDKIAANPLLAHVDPDAVKPSIVTLTQSTYDGVLYNTETIKKKLDGYIPTLHFDEAWLPHAAFHDFYGQFHAMGKNRPRPKEAMVYATQSTHKLLAGISQASQVLVQDSQSVKLDKHLFNEAYLMHTSTSPQYSIIASCDVAAAMMEPPGGTALVEESIRESLDFRRAMRKVDGEYGDDWWFKVWGPDYLRAEEGSEPVAADWMLHADEEWHGFGALAEGFNMLDPIKSTIITPGLDMEGRFAATGIPASVVTKFLVEHGVVVEKTGLYSFFIMFTIGITKGRWNTLLTAFAAVQGRLRQECAAVADPAGVLPAVPQVRAHGPARPVPEHPPGLCRGRYRAPDDGHVPVQSAAGHDADGCLRPHRPAQDRARRHRRPGRPHHDLAADALPARHPAADPGRALQQEDRRLPQVHAQLQRQVPGLRDRCAWTRARDRRRDGPWPLLRGLRQGLTVTGLRWRCARAGLRGGPGRGARPPG